MTKIKVLSLFNGMNCIGLALHNLGIEFELYASEIDKYATKVSDTLFPNTVNLGDVTKIDLEKLPVFDLVVGGSPCQGFSFAGKRLNFEDERSKLFFDFVKIVKHCKKKNPELKFLLENVKMKQQHEAVISRFMGIDPIQINSSLLSAQNRKRLYWTNIGTTTANLFGIEEPGIKQPKDKGILLKDILEAEVDEKYYLSKKAIDYMGKNRGSKSRLNWASDEKEKKSMCVTSNFSKGIPYGILKCDRKGNVKNNQNKSSSLTVGGNGCGNHSDMDVLIIPEATKKGFAEIKEGNCFDATFLNSNTRRGRSMEDKSNTLTAANFDFCRFENAKIRRLTPKECGRLQTVPSWAIEKMLNCGVSDSQLYKMLGNGWTVEVISYILSHNTWKK